MSRTSRNNAVCPESLEEALAESPEAYRHIDLIAFGFPCQDISNANPKGKGIKGERSSIFFECIRIVNIIRPAWLLIENVPRLLSINGGRDFAIILQTLSESGYGYVWRILDSQYFGVAQRRKRVFIVGCFGKPCPAEILFEQKSGRRHDKKKRKIRPRGLCVLAGDGTRQDPTCETLIASTIQSTDKKLRKFGFGENIVASTIQATDYRKVQHGQFGNEGNLIAQAIQAEKHGRNSTSQIVAQTVNAAKRGNAMYVWQDTHIAEANPDRKGKVAGTTNKLDTVRGVLIGNAVTVQVAEWIAGRIYNYIKNET